MCISVMLSLALQYCFLDAGQQLLDIHTLDIVNVRLEISYPSAIGAGVCSWLDHFFDHDLLCFFGVTWTEKNTP